MEVKKVKFYKKNVTDIAKKERKKTLTRSDPKIWSTKGKVLRA